MAAEFCKTCKIGTKHRCKACPKTKRVYKDFSTGGCYQPEWTTLLGGYYWRVGDEAEEYF